jgi:hypothetical protein
MKQAIYIFSLYIGVVTFFTLSSFGIATDLSMAVALLAILGSCAIIYTANKNEAKKA